MYMVQVPSPKKLSSRTRLNRTRAIRALTVALIVGLALPAVGASSGAALAQTQKPNIVLSSPTTLAMATPVSTAADRAAACPHQTSIA